MGRNGLRPLRAIVEGTLREARLMHAKRTASSIALLALSGGGLPSSALAEEYFVSNGTELRDAIYAANANTADPSATITMTASFAATSVPAPNKPITINTQSFTLTGVSVSNAGSGLTFAGAVAGVNGAGAASGQIALTANFNASVVNSGAITGGAGGGAGGNGGGGVSLLNDSTATNNGTIRGGSANAGAGAAGATVGGRSSLINNEGGLIQGGNGQIGGGSGVTVGSVAGNNRLINHGVIRGGTSLNGAPGGVGLSVRLGTLPIVNTGTIEGGNGQVAINNNGGSVNFTFTNSGIIRAGSGQAVAIQMGGATTVSVIELQAGSLIEGNVIASAANITDTLRLGGDVDSVFASDIGAGAQYQNFDRFEKTGASTWSLTGTANIATPWQILAGTLQLGDGGTSGSIIGNVTNNGMLAFNRSDTLTYGGVISGTGSVRQVGAGTTILTGTNIYTGATAIDGGVLQVSSDANLGAGASALSFNGGALQTTADFNSARAINLVGSGGFITAGGTTLTLNGTISGAGSLTKEGAGRLVLAADNSYTGGTSINAGVLQIGDGGTSGNLASNITNNGTLAFNRSDAFTFAGVVGGNGVLNQSSAGTTILTADNTYTGGTTISAGTLQLGDGGSSGSIVGDVVNNGILAFNRSDAFAFGGAISGTGSVNQIGSGTTILTGDSNFAGGTIISGGALQLGNGGTSGSLTGDVTSNGTLIFNRSNALAFAGAIIGDGVLRQSGAGTTTLSAAGSNVSSLEVQGGALELTSTASLSAGTMSVAAGSTLRNEGMLTGTPGDNTFTLAGTFIGSASLLDGDDQVQIADGAIFSQARFDGGAGFDTLDLASGSAFTLPQTLATGFESLIKRGGGVLTLSGTVDGFSDSIAVAAGAMHLNSASIQTNELRIDFGATVTGRGSLSGSLYNAGLLSPGNSPGTVHVGGNYTQHASGALVSEISRAGTDLLDVAGSATLAGTHQIQIEYGLYLDGTTHTLLQAAGGITGDFASEQMNPSALLEVTRELSANALTVSFARQPITSLTKLSDGRARFATYLEEQLAAGTVDATMSDYIDTLLQQPTDEQVASLLGERAEPVASVSQSNISILGAGFSSTVFERFTSGDTAQCASARPGSNDTLNCFWAHGLRQWGNASVDARYDWTTEGGQIGVDRTLSPEFALGATFGYADTGIGDLNGGRNDLRSRMGGLYANYASGRLTLGALAFYSGNESETHRNVLVGAARQQARADFDGDSYGASVRLGYRVTSDVGPLVRPYIEAFYDRIEATQFAETGAGTGNLSARIHGRDGLRGTLGLQLANDFEGYGKVFRPTLEVGVAHQFGDARSTMDLQPFSNVPAFRTYGPALDRTSYIARASLNVSLGDNASLALGYGGELSDDYSQHEGNLSFRVAW